MAINRDKVEAQAIKLLQQGKLDKAIVELKKIVEHDPTDVRTLLKMGDTYVKLGAKKESIDAILEMAGHKRDGTCSRLVVTGCLAQRYRDELKKEIPEIDALLGTGEVPDILGALAARSPLSAVRSSAVPLKLFRASDFGGPRTAESGERIADSASGAAAPCRSRAKPESLLVRGKV